MKIEDIKYEISDKIISEKDFDVEKWRIENPMDYFKAMYLINTSRNREEVFKVIYQVSRLHIPKTLFKYFSLTDSLSLNEKKLDTLQQKKIFMSNVKDLNDPFDNKAYFYKPEVLKKYERLAEHGGKLIDDFSAFTKVSSLTSNNVNSMPMWAHYANNHAGFCVSYDMELNIELRSCTFPVQYTSERIDITSIMDNQAQKIVQAIEKQSQQGKKEILLDDLSLVYMTTYFCNIKHISWSYESEFRCTTGSNAKGMPYLSATPKEIYIGKNCKPIYVERIIKIAKELQVPVFQMIFDDLTSEFNLIARRI
jgi:hypothetical protein